MTEHTDLPTPETVTGKELLPIPDIVLPDQIKQERMEGILSVLNNQPNVDCIHVLGRSGTLAATGIYDDPHVQARFHLPPLFPIDGIGNEVWLEWKQMMRNDDRDDEIPEEGIGEYADDETRQPFNEWVAETSSQHVQTTIALLRSLPRSMRRIAILDDMKQSGSVVLGVAPALYKAAYGDDFEYNQANNRYIFKSSNWIDQIITASFQNVSINKRQMELLAELAKGNTDWPGFKHLQTDNIHSLDQLASHFATQYLGPESRNIPPDTVYELIETYGLNLFSLHEGFKSALRRHSQEVLLEE